MVGGASIRIKLSAVFGDAFVSRLLPDYGNGSVEYGQPRQKICGEWRKMVWEWLRGVILTAE